MAAQSYTIQDGDTLSSIAAKFYGDENQWNQIYEANREAIGENPDNIAVGLELTIP
jgi:nucleoid-associated protein YgaU